MSSARFNEVFGTSHPVVQGPMAGVAGPALVSAVAEAGGLSVLPLWLLPPPLVAPVIAQVRALTDRPFAGNFRADLVQLDVIATALDAGMSFVHLFWGDPEASMAPVRRANAPMLATIGDADSAKAALDAGASALIAQGVEAGGHVLGSTPIEQLLPIACELAGDVPVIAAGGISTAEDAARMRQLGASGVLAGTRFVATAEADAHPIYKRLLLDASSEDTVRTELFDGSWPDAPHRVLRNSTFAMWEQAGSPAAGARPGEGEITMHNAMLGLDVPRYHAMLPSTACEGDVEAAALYAGMGVNEVTRELTAAEVVNELAMAFD